MGIEIAEVEKDLSQQTWIHKITNIRSSIWFNQIRYFNVVLNET